MIPKFSVKKPYTVMVAVVLVLILGVVSFTNMTTDLLPSMNLPYALVITTYPGASPEEVETRVTRPVEQAMATVSNIESIQSVSSQNMSMVVLEFSQTTNMDSVSLEMRENLDQIKAYWDDSIGSPMIMKLNPDMMPIMVAAMEKDDLDNIGITDLAENELLSELESIEGVASVETSGEVEESVHVTIRQDKIDSMNQKVAEALGLSFADARQELDDAQEKLDDAQAQLDSGKAQMDSGKNAMASQLGEAKTKLQSGQMDLLKTEIDLENKLAEIESAEAELAQAEQAKSSLEQLKTQKTQVTSGLEQAQAGLTQMQAGYDLLQQQYDAAVAAGDTDKIAELTPQMAAMKAQMDSLEGEIASLEATLELLDGNIASLEAVVAQLPDDETIAASKAQLSEAKTQIQDAKQQVDAGKLTMSQALGQLNQKEISATIEMASASAQLSSGEAQLKQGQEQLDEGGKQLKDAQKDALEAADLEDRITPSMISQILVAQNFSMPAGYVSEDGVQYLVRVGDKLSDTEDLEDLVLFDMGLDNLNPIKLSDVADVAVVNNSSEVYAKINGKPGVLVTMQKQTGYSTGDVSDRIKEKFEKLEKEYDGLHFTALMDQGLYIDVVVDSVLNNLMSGAVLAILILFLFLKDIRPTAVVACSIPISVLGAVVLMYFSGISLNIISLSGLALGVGMLVDNSIVVIENIYRMRSLGVPICKAAVQGARQVSGAITASTLTTVCVFLPVVFTKGITRQLFVDMGLTIGYSLLASLAIALTLVPAMSTGVLKKNHEKKHPFLDRMSAAYEKLMTKLLKRKALVLLGSLALLIVSMVLALRKGTSFMPSMESTQTSITVTMPKGSTVEETGAMADEVMARLTDLKDVEEMGAMAGSSSGMRMLMGGSSSESASIYVILSEDKELTGQELSREIQERTKDLDCEISVSTDNMDMSALGGSGIQVQIRGREMDTLQKVAGDVADILENTEGLQDISDGMEESTEELRLAVNKEAASEHNLTVAQVYQQIQSQLAEASSATTLSTESKDYGVFVIDEAQTEYIRDDVKNFTITATDQEGKTEEIPLEDLVDFVDANGPDSIQRVDQTRYLTVSAVVSDAYNIGLLGDEVQDKLDDYEVPEGYSIKMAGEDETIQDAMTEVLKMLGLAVIFIYLIMVAQFQSLLSPFIVMFTMPLAFTGGFLGLVVANQEVSVIAMIGFVMLTGIIVNNGIVLVDYINQLRAGGMEKRKAIVTAGKTRMRPILMTALTTILGLSTMALGMGMGSDMVQPMAVVTIGGLLYGTILTLFVVPCIYDILNRKEYRSHEEAELDEVDYIPETVEKIQENTEGEI